jgi:hypothetical protein
MNLIIILKWQIIFFQYFEHLSKINFIMHGTKNYSCILPRLLIIINKQRIERKAH